MVASRYEPEQRPDQGFAISLGSAAPLLAAALNLNASGGVGSRGGAEGTAVGRTQRGQHGDGDAGHPVTAKISNWPVYSFPARHQLTPEQISKSIFMQ